MCLQTPFVRQNTPHPRELKAKAHKLFSKGQNSLEDSDLQTEPAVEAINQHVKQQNQQQRTPEPELHIQQPYQQQQVPIIQPPLLPPEPLVGNGAEESSEPSDDTDDVSHIKIN